jgi:hypothetical protein
MEIERKEQEGLRGEGARPMVIARLTPNGLYVRSSYDISSRIEKWELSAQGQNEQR